MADMQLRSFRPNSSCIRWKTECQQGKPIDPLELNLFVYVYLVALELLAVLLNSLVILMFLKRNELLLLQRNKFVLNLSVSALLASLTAFPSTLMAAAGDNWLRGNTACQLLGYCHVSLFSVVIATLALLAHDRYLCILRPLRYPALVTSARTNTVILCAWLASMATGALPLMGWSEYRYNDVDLACSASWSSSISFACFFIAVAFVVPTSICLWTHANVLTVAQKHSRFGRRVSRVAVVPLEIERILRETSARKTTKTSAIICGLYLVTWTPCIVAIAAQASISQTEIYSAREWLVAMTLTKYPMLFGFPYVFVFRARGLRRQMGLFLSSSPRGSDIHRGPSRRSTQTTMPRFGNSTVCPVNEIEPFSSHRSSKRVSFQLSDQCQPLRSEMLASETTPCIRRTSAFQPNSPQDRTHASLPGQVDDAST